MEPKELLETARLALEDKKAEDIRVIEIGEISEIADYFLLATASNPNQMEALVDNVEEKLGKAGAVPRSIEGSPRENSNWVLMDYNDVVIHIFSKEGREFYNLEKIWR